jgi:hypothetical protein
VRLDLRRTTAARPKRLEDAVTKLEATVEDREVPLGGRV